MTFCHNPAPRSRRAQVIPPPGWKPWKRRPDLGAIRIKTPIKQHVFGKSGAYVAILEEQRVRPAACSSGCGGVGS